MITVEKLIDILIFGRTECYVKKSATYNPYIPGENYDWHFKLEQGEYLFTDSYRGFNPYSGVEYVYIKGQPDPIWACDYVGYVLANSFVSEKDIYHFLKKGRGKHLLDCGRDLFVDHAYKDGDFVYETRFNGNLNAILQTEQIYYLGTMIAMQVSAGYLREKGILLKDEIIHGKRFTT